MSTWILSMGVRRYSGREHQCCSYRIELSVDTIPVPLPPTPHTGVGRNPPVILDHVKTMQRRWRHEPKPCINGEPSLEVKRLRDGEISVCFISEQFGGSMRLNPQALTWTPGLCSSGDRSGDRLDRNEAAAHRVGTHTRSEEGVKSDRAGK